MVTVTDREFVDALPKAELHVHLEGSMPPELLLELRNKYGIEQVPASVDAIRDWYEFRGFEHFIEVYQTSVLVLREADDFALLTATVGAQLAAQNVRYAELSVSPSHYLRRGISIRELFAGLEAGRRAVEREHGIVLRWIADSVGQLGLELSEQMLDGVLADGPDSVVAIGLGGPEVPRPPYAPLFDRARAAGLHSVPHAGEWSGPQTIWDALDALRAERIGHGIACVQDPDLVRRLAEDQIVLEVCPTSNLRTRAVASYAEHPLRRMLDAGLAVTVNSDDPPMFGTTLTAEYLAALTELGLSRTELVDCVRTAVRGSFAPESAKAELLADLDSAAAAE